ncbi:MAG TPA: hypothetical protein VNA44_05150 [Burkholderiaceae bacterium]|nr:hypothetical protein [Burkholderiaceae bacterium]
MYGHLIVLAAASVVLVGCNSRESSEPAKTPLPTRQTTIDPVNKKLDTAREDAERRRQQADDAYK